MTFYMMAWQWLRLAQIPLDGERDLLQLTLERRMTAPQYHYISGLMRSLDLGF
jgi:hypothetical protein